MNTITSKKAYKILMDAKNSNDGEWIDHSIYVGIAAKRIAEHVNGLNPDLALAYGYIHDIGRTFGRMQLKHSICGYEFLKKEGYDEAARICLTHSFISKDIEECVGNWDCTDSEYIFVKDYIESIKFTEYDKLIQLCDAISLSTGFTIIEKRLIDVALRYGINERTTKRWKAFFNLQKDFENKLGFSLYQLFPEVIDNI
ncbi:HD domain protein [Clostridium puniceum]|uniref:HD domain protein n=1 Tax=Clostridium puniceum TaxID=29367 RepID=A0A1S8T0D2_9CLOT|nr:HD domain-containing protein [Clostridium puniceum]OOM71139.1 HD domain protein [Clostridium puniceum]